MLRPQYNGKDIKKKITHNFCYTSCMFGLGDADLGRLFFFLHTHPTGQKCWAQPSCSFYTVIEQLDHELFQNTLLKIERKI